MSTDVRIPLLPKSQIPAVLFVEKQFVFRNSKCVFS